MRAKVGVSHRGARKGNTVPRILVADDNTNIQKMVTLAFQERGVEVIAVGNGEAAVRRIPDANPDLVLADVFMPVRNGYEVCEFVKKDSRFAQTPVILLVGAFDPLDEKEARRVGADGVLKKPFVPPDPLIAMVMSALEKNPRVMAEWAKAKEAAAAAVEVPRVAALENPANAEPKPLPHFPEPTAEEAAIIYGFGKGVRGLDADEEEAEAKASEPAAPKVAESKGPKAASGSKISVSAAEDDEEFDDVSTATDRRRQNTDFEVPENIGSDPIYSYGRDFEPITFPSEKDVPPKHVKEDAVAESAEAKTQNVKATEVETVEAPALLEVAAAASKPEPKEDETSEWDIRPAAEIAAAPVAQAEAPAQEQAEVPAAAAVVEEAPAVELVSGEVAQEEAPAPFIPKPLPERVFDVVREAEPVAHSEAPAPAIAASSETHSSESHQESTSRGGWMDMMSPVPSQPAESHWMETLSSGAPQAHADERPIEVEATAHADEPAPVEANHEAAQEPGTHQPAEIEAKAEEVVEPAALASVEAEAPAASSSASDWSEQLPAAPAIDLGSQFDTEPRNFSDGAPQFGGNSYHFASNESEVEHEQFASAEKDETAPVIETPSELMVSPADAPRSEVEHAPSEPIFVNDNIEATSDYAALAEESLPAEQQAEPQPEPAFAETLESQEGLLEPAASSFFESSEAVAAEEDYSERIPTLPPANREALADIAFLMPPPGATEITPSTNGSDSNSHDVDAVVRKVLEKLQPQLQEMLSQGMKPLLENLVQNELQKKDR
jgi:CheY-like chemotaxis protein